MVTFSEKVSFIRSVFGEIIIDSSQQNIAVSCPSCNDKSKKKFSININTWQCHCWVCGVKSKSLLSILKRYSNPDRVGVFLSSFHAGEITSNAHDNEAGDCQLELPSGFELLVDNIDTRDPDMRSCINYVRKRGLTRKDMWRFMLGSSKYGRFKRRIIMPSFNVEGDLNFFVGRAIDPDARRKYINSDASKKMIIFNEINIEWNKPLTLVEGPFDLMKSNFNSTCLLGSSLSKESALFYKIVTNKTPIVLALDSDMREKTQKYAQLLSYYDCDVRILDIRDSHDVGSLTKEEFGLAYSKTKPWCKNDGLKYRINSIKSGSLI